LAFDRLSRLLRPTVEREVDDELEFHLEMRAGELAETTGMDPAAARRAAERRFSDLERTRKECRKIARGRDSRERRREWWSEFRQDLAFAGRQMTRAPGFTAVTVLTLALGIGATTAIYSVLRAVVLEPLPFPEAERLHAVDTTWRGSPGGTSAGNYLYIREHQRSYASLAAVDYRPFNLSDGDVPERVLGAAATYDYLPLLGLPPARGRTFSAEEDAPGNDGVVVLSHRLFKSRFGSDPQVVGRRIRVSGVAREVIGVMPEALDAVSSGEQLWVPIAFTPERRAMYDEHFLSLYGRLRPDVSLAQARANLESVVRDLVRDHARDNADRGVTASPLLDQVVGDYRERLTLLLGAVGLVLLIACANAANLLLGRGAARERELAVRAAVGAGRARIVRQLLTESLLLGGLAASLGIAVAEIGRRLLVATAPEGVPRLEAARIDGGVLVFAALAGLVSSVLFGLAPALHASRVDLRPGLGEGGRTVTSGGGRDRLRRLLVAAEVALAITLLAGAGLLVRTGVNLTRAPLGFDAEGLLTARVGFPREGYADHERMARAFEAVIERLRARPSVEAAFVSKLPLTPGAGTNGLIPEGRTVDPQNPLKSVTQSDLQIVSPGYFETMRIPLRAGRYLTAEDRRGASKVMVVNEELARVAFPGQSAVGRRIACCEPGPGGPDTPSWKEVVGVVANVSRSSPGGAPPPQFYLPHDQVPPEAWDWISRTMGLVARGGGGPAALVPLLREAVRSVDPAVPVYDVQTMLERRRGRMSQERFGATLLSALGLVGLALAAVGIYGVVAFFVSQRTREIAVRLALGAGPRDVVSLVMRQGLRPVLFGLLAGVAGALAAGRALQVVLFGVSPVDALTLVVVGLILLSFATLACLLPARRASRVDPARTLAEA
jgi:putative ABC transport system permease protein